LASSGVPAGLLRAVQTMRIVGSMEEK
jgi:hypothetical protein